MVVVVTLLAVITMLTAVMAVTVVATDTNWVTEPHIAPLLPV